MAQELAMNVCVMCGHDAQLYASLSRRLLTTQPVRIQPVPFTEHFQDYLWAADCVVARPSAGVFNECLLAGVPMVVFGRPTLNDRGAAFLIEKHALGAVCPDRKQLPETVASVLQKKQEYRAKIKAFLSSYPTTYQEQRDTIIGEVREALALCGGKHGLQPRPTRLKAP